MRRLAGTIVSLVFWVALRPACAEDLGLKMPPEFRVSTFADERLANDIYAMTLDSHGRVVVTSRGYVKTLHDDDGDGKADRATEFTETSTGGMGLCCDGDTLYFCGDGWLSRYRDADADGRADGPPEKLVPLAFGEHGGHAIRKGPDGWWYVIGGNDARIGRTHVTLGTSPVKNPEAGAILRLPPNADGKQCEVVAHGFRNPYDFDFNAAGDLFTYDSDCERDYFLPWYSPTRVYHVAEGGHHGWRLPSHLRSWARCPDYLDTVGILWPIGRGSPTGVACYRHVQFPEHYRGGVFALDWTFGKVYFLPLKPDGATYRSRGEVFIEPTGTQGFAPTDAAVAPDGSLLISIGGRGTRGAVYRVEYVGKNATPPAEPKNDAEHVLRAPQPLDAWSRKRWEPLARQLGRETFLKQDVVTRGNDGVRAVEILTDLFDGLTEELARAAAGADLAEIRARTAWSLGRKPCPNAVEILGTLASDDDPRVQRQALDAMALMVKEASPAVVRKALEGLACRDRRVAQSAARFAAKLSDEQWDSLKPVMSSSPAGALAQIWRHPEVSVHPDAIETALGILSRSSDNEERLQAVRLIVLALGDWHLIDPPVEVYTAYSVQPALASDAPWADPIRQAVRPLIASNDPRLQDEAARLLAIFEDDDPELLKRVASLWTAASHPTRDFHFLIVFSRLKGERDSALTEQTARAVLALDRKLDGQEMRSKQTWSDRLAEVTTRLLERDPKLADALLRAPNFTTPGHVAIALCLPEAQRRQAAERFLDAVKQGTEFTWTGLLIDLLALLPPGELHPVLRAQWENFGLRDAIVLRLATLPEDADRAPYLWGLDSEQPQVVRASLAALARLPRDPAPEHLVPLVRLLHRALHEPKDGEVRTRVVSLLARQAGESLTIAEGATDPASLRKTYEPVFAWFEREHPKLAGSLNGSAVDLGAWRSRLKGVDWSRGDASRGAALFQRRACQTCHTGQRALGPDLNGATSRFTREDLFTAIAAPSLDVSPLYRTTLVATRDGQVHSGLVAFESADGLILQTGAATTVRIATADIAERRPGSRSLMPEGLLQDLEPADLADLYQYLQTLTPRNAARR
ncbi:MAG: hypothetical protein P4L84_28260 [Isosphaeraceae bacterium]|nr:hypothetical protein [Isosphaeraceae bacterium]